MFIAQALKAALIWVNPKQNVPILFEPDGSIVATNGFGLIKLQIHDTNTKHETTKEQPRIFLSIQICKALLEMIKIISKIHKYKVSELLCVQQTSNSITLSPRNNQNKEVTESIIVPHAESTFPNYQNLLTSQFMTSKITVRPEYLKKIAESAMAIQSTRIDLYIEPFGDRPGQKFMANAKRALATIEIILACIIE